MSVADPAAGDGEPPARAFPAHRLASEGPYVAALLPSGPWSPGRTCGLQPAGRAHNKGRELCRAQAGITVSSSRFAGPFVLPPESDSVLNSSARPGG